MIPTVSLEIGMYLCTNIYDSSGTLLLAKDNLIESDRQLSRILEATNYYTFIDTEKGRDVKIDDIVIDRNENPYFSYTYEASQIIEFAREFEIAKSLFINSVDETERLLDDEQNGYSSIHLTKVINLLNKFIESIERSSKALFIIAKTFQSKNYLIYHTLNVTIISMLLAKYSGYKRQDIIGIGLAGYFHDFGLAEVPADILNKNDKLTDDEWVIIKRHPKFSLDRIKNISGFPSESIQAILEHHERIDGSGYPKGLHGESISDFAGIVAIADVFDAMTTNRSYNEGFSLHEGVSVLYGLKELKSDLIGKFINVIGIYPIGTLVKLTSGEVGIVISVNSESLLRPMIGVVFDAERVKRENLYEYIDLSNVLEESAIEKVLEPKIWEIDISEYFENLVPYELFS